jgi:hypothetical protein
MAMPVKLRKAIGAAALLVFIPLYASLAVQIAIVHVPQDAIVAQTIYFAIAGLLWIIPAGLIIRWMLKPRPGDPVA